MQETCRYYKKNKKRNYRTMHVTRTLHTARQPNKLIDILLLINCLFTIPFMDEPSSKDTPNKKLFYCKPFPTHMVKNYLRGNEWKISHDPRSY